VGFAAVLYDEHGLLGEFYGGTQLADPSSWVAEWFGKFLGCVCVSRFAPGALLLLSDNTSVTLDGTRVRPSGSPVVDGCVRFLFQMRVEWQVEEGFIPAAHDTNSSSAVSAFQARADELAALGRLGAPLSRGYHFLNCWMWGVFSSSGGWCV
jgi:hypothetical protein